MFDRIKSLLTRGKAGPNRNGTPQFVGDVLAYKMCDRFNLPGLDLAKMVRDDLGEVAVTWAVLYVSWIFYAGVRENRGAAFASEMVEAAKSRLDSLEQTRGLGDRLKSNLALLDDAATNLGETAGVHLPMEYFAALTFLGLQLGNVFADDTDLVIDVTGLLDSAKTHTVPLIEEMINAVAAMAKDPGTPAI